MVRCGPARVELWKHLVAALAASWAVVLAAAPVVAAVEESTPEPRLEGLRVLDLPAEIATASVCASLKLPTATYSASRFAVVRMYTTPVK